MTGTAAHPKSSLVEILREHEQEWSRRALLRAVYRDWYELIADSLSAVDGATVELGSGLGSLRQFVPDAVLTDVEPTPWADEVVNAEELPYEDASVAKLVLPDVL